MKSQAIVASEYSECCLLAQYLDLLKRTGKIQLYSHIAQETYTPSWAAKNRNKAMGVMGGVPDYVIVTNDKVLWIEMKKSKGGKTSDNQKLWIEGLNRVGQMAVVCNGYNEAEEFLKSNIKVPATQVKKDLADEMSSGALEEGIKVS